MLLGGNKSNTTNENGHEDDAGGDVTARGRQFYIKHVVCHADSFGNMLKLLVGSGDYNLKFAMVTIQTCKLEMVVW